MKIFDKIIDISETHGRRLLNYEKAPACKIFFKTRPTLRKSKRNCVLYRVNNNNKSNNKNKENQSIEVEI